MLEQHGGRPRRRTSLWFDWPYRLEPELWFTLHAVSSVLLSGWPKVVRGARFIIGGKQHQIRPGVAQIRSAHVLQDFSPGLLRLDKIVGKLFHSHAPCVPAAHIYDLKSEDLRVRVIITLPANPASTPCFPENPTQHALLLFLVRHRTFTISLFSQIGTIPRSDRLD